MAEIIFLVLALVAGSQGIPISEEDALLAEFDNDVIEVPFGFTKMSDGLYYKYVSRNLNFNDANRNCYPGHLAIIHSQETNLIVAGMTGTGYAWLGLKKDSAGNSWQWSDQSVVSYTNWINDVSELNNEGNCVEIIGAYHTGWGVKWTMMWDDEQCGTRQPSICQWKKPTPTTVRPLIQTTLATITPKIPTTAISDILTLKNFFYIPDWDTIEERSLRSQAKKFVDEKVQVYYSIDPRRAMTDLAEVGSILTLAYSGSKGYKCSTTIIDVMSSYQDVVKDSLIVSSTFVEIVIQALKYHKYAIQFAGKGSNELSIKYLRKCSEMAQRMADESEILIKKSDKLTVQAHEALKQANRDFVGTEKEKKAIEKTIKKINEDIAALKSESKDIKERKAEAAKKERENAALATETTTGGIFVKIFTAGIIDIDEENQAEARRKSELARKERIAAQKEEQQNNAEMAASVKRLMQTAVDKNELKKSIYGLDITIKIMGKVKTIFLNAKTFWTGIKKHVESLAATQEQLEDWASHEDFHKEFVAEIGLSGYSWLAIGKICRMSALAITEVNKGMDATMHNIPTEAEARGLIKTLGNEILQGLKEDAEEIKRELNSVKNQPKKT